MFLKSIASLALSLSAVYLFGAMENFETYPSGRVAQMDCECGTWSENPSWKVVPSPGEKPYLNDNNTAEIMDGQGFDGGKALRIRGGKRRLSLKAKTPFEKESILSFRAKRWTKADPFKFRIDFVTRKGTGVSAETVYGKVYENNRIPMDYSDVISLKLGAFVTEVCFEVETPDAKPDHSGLLLDNVSWEAVKPMEITQVSSVQEVIPMLKGHSANDALYVDVMTQGDENPTSLRGVSLSFNGTTRLSDISEVKLVRIPDGKVFASAEPAKTLELKGSLPLQSGRNRFAVRCELDPKADIDHHIDVQCTNANFSDGAEKVPEVAKDQPYLRMGLVLRAQNQDQCKAYRIPGLTTTLKGTLIAVYDNRYKHSGDLQGDIDIGMSRSTDGGKNWEPMKVIMDMGKANGFPEDLNGCTDPAVLTDTRTGAVWATAMWISGVKGHTWFASKPGMEPTVTGQFMLVRSDDDGKTWSKPINVTSQMKKPEWNLFFQGPGRGITMRDGTLVFAAQYKDAKSVPHSTVISSKDQGQTWTVGVGAKPRTTEAQVVELDNGELMLNMRDDNGGSRSVCTTSDLGQTWKEHSSSRKALIEPVCQASILRWSSVKDGAEKSILLFSNPAVKRAPREMMSLKVSFDEGLTWSEPLTYDMRDCFGYSCLTKIDETHIGVIYEGKSEMYFLRIPIGEILSK